MPYQLAPEEQPSTPQQKHIASLLRFHDLLEEAAIAQFMESNPESKQSPTHIQVEYYGDTHDFSVILPEETWVTVWQGEDSGTGVELSSLTQWAESKGEKYIELLNILKNY